MSSTDFAKQARAHFDRGAFQEAATVCRRGLLANPGDVETRLLLGRALMSLQRYAEVLAEMRVLLEREPGNPQGLALRGEALLYKGDVPKAVQALRDAQAAAPHDPAIRALRTRAEQSAASDKRGFVFVDEDPSSNATRHYASGPGPSSGRGALGGDASESFDDLFDEEPQARAPVAPRAVAPASPRAAAPASPRAAAPPARPTPPSPPGPSRKPPAANPAAGKPAANPAAGKPAPGKPAPGKPAPRNIAPGPGAPAPASAAGSSSGMLPEQSGSFDEPTAIYGDGQFGSKGASLPALPGAAAPTRGPALGAPDRARDAAQTKKPVSKPISAMQSVRADAVDAEEFDDEMAPTSMIDVDRSLRRPESNTAPGAQRYSTQATTDEALPPALPPATLPGTTMSPVRRNAPPPPPGAPAPPAPGSPMARVQAATGAGGPIPARVAAPVSPRSPEMPAARAAAADARRAPLPQPA
ncbi:MAG TPA: tetratricopeptide repeat protein, partial [Haliangium sp.]|nr:tetratricopeptide repeat protein [Haliangium sp.]